MEKTASRTATGKKGLVWAIDPFEKDTQPDSSLVRKLMSWAEASDLELQPVHILNIPGEEAQAYWGDTSVSPQIPAAEKACEQYLRDLGVKMARTTKILVNPSEYAKGAVQRLVEFSEKTGSPWIVVSSHGRSGVGRLLLGSFAENLLQQAKCPVFFLTHLKHDEESKKQMKRVLFPTDFSVSSREAFLRFLIQAVRFGFDIVLFHSVSFPMAAASGLGAVPVIPPNYFSDQEQWANEEGKKWITLAQSQGITARLIVKNEGVIPQTGKAILMTAQEQDVGLIAMAALSGPFTSFGLGSVAKEVFRANQVPVWVYGPKALKKKYATEHSASA